MTKKDYELIAEGLRLAMPGPTVPTSLDQFDIQAYRKGRGDAWRNTCKTVADRLALANPRFSTRMFLTACGLNPEQM